MEKLRLNDAKLTAQLNQLDEEANRRGLELAPLLVGWYNQSLEDKSYAFDYPENTLALVAISNPSFFRTSFMAYLRSSHLDSSSDLFDECMRVTVNNLLAATVPKETVKVIYDFDIDAETFRPGFLAQVGAHASGIARCYRQPDLDQEGIKAYQDLNGGSQEEFKAYPVCLHPRHGGWFGIRCLIILEGVKVDASLMSQPDPPTVLTSQTDIAKVLYRYNNHWADNTWRNVGVNVKDKYSDAQKEYFAQMPDQRSDQFVKGILDKLEKEIQSL